MNIINLEEINIFQVSERRKREKVKLIQHISHIIIRSIIYAHCYNKLSLAELYQFPLTVLQIWATLNG